MRKFFHAFNTWAFTIALLIAGVLGYLVVFESSDILDAWMMTNVMTGVFLIYLAALPGFFMLWLTLALIVESKYGIVSMIILYFFLGFIAAFLNITFLVILLEPIYLTWEFLLIKMWPVYAALYVSLTTRLYFFFQLVIHERRKDENNSSTTNLNTIENGNDS